MHPYRQIRTLAIVAILTAIAVGGMATLVSAQGLGTLPIQMFQPSDFLVLPSYIKPQCDILDQIDKFRVEMTSMPLAIGPKNYRYVEKRAGTTKIYNEPETQIALGLLNPDTCERRVVTITKRGNQLIAPSGYDIEALERLNGIQWNYWNTMYKVNEPDGRFVAANVFPYEETRTITREVPAKNGKTKRITEKKTEVVPVFYVPFTEGLARPELVEAGTDYSEKISNEADDYLRRHSVYSRAYPDLLIVDVPQLKSDYVERKLPIEHMDESEFAFDPRQTTDRIFALIGANRSGFAQHVCSKAAACGPRQFIAGTWKMVGDTYPSADLPIDFLTGARDPLYSAVAARLLDDYNLAELRSSLSATQYETLTNDSQMLEEALASAYNTGVTRTIKVLQAYLTHPDRYADWIDAKGKVLKSNLIAQTKIYIQKLRYVRNEWPALVALRTSEALDR